MSDPILSMLLAERGCPYEAGTLDSVVWMLGYKAGLEAAKATVDRAVYASPEPTPVEPARPDWRVPRSRRSLPH